MEPLGELVAYVAQGSQGQHTREGDARHVGSEDATNPGSMASRLAAENIEVKAPFRAFRDVRTARFELSGGMGGVEARFPRAQEV